MIKKGIIIFNLFFYAIFFPVKKIQAQTITLSPKINIISPSPKNNNLSENISHNLLIDFMKTFLEIYYKKKLNNNQNDHLNEALHLPITPISVSPSTLNEVKREENFTPNINGLVYYPQCKGPYDNYSLPEGGTICEAGCGPTTVAMILASYVDRRINPMTVVNMYKEKKFKLGPNGSNFIDAEKILKEHQFKTRYVFARDKKIGGITINEVMKTYGNQVKNLQNEGWTFFSLADFKSGGHYFWVIKFDDNLNIFAYDPAYDIPKPKPINHKSRYPPYPKFRVIMAIIK